MPGPTATATLAIIDATTMATVAAVALAVVFVVAAVSKLLDREGTVEGFGALGLPSPKLLSIAVPAGELAIAALLLSARTSGAMVAFAALVGFTVFLAGLLRSGRPVACRCFGGATSEPISASTLVRNGVFIWLAIVAMLPGLGI